MKKLLMNWLVNNKTFITALSLFFLTAVLLMPNINKPFYGEHDWNGVRYGNIARNYLRYGLIQTKLGQIENSGLAAKKEFEFLTHYPPLLPILISLGYRVLGISEWSTRVIPLVFTSGSIVLIFLIGQKLFSYFAGLSASLFGVLTPLTLYFGKNPVHEPLVVFFVLLSFYGYLLTRDHENKLFKIVFIVGLILAHLTTWAGYFLLPALTIVALLKRDFKQFKRLLPFYIIPIVLFLIHLIYIFWLTGSFCGGGFCDVYLQRTGISQAGQIDGLNFLNYLFRLRLWISNLFTQTLTILALIWLVQKTFQSKGDNDWKLISLGIFGVIYLALFPNASFIHNYLVFYLLPFMSLAGSLVVMQLGHVLNIKGFKITIMVAVLSLIFFEKLGYLRALNASQGDKFAFELGKAINSQTAPEKNILVVPLGFSYSAGNFLKFYSDRNLIFSDDKSVSSDILIVVDQASQRFKITSKEDLNGVKND